MKNFIPIILAVLLGLAAVLAVSRMIARNKLPPAEESWVVAAQRDLKKGDAVKLDSLLKKVIPSSAQPADAILWSKRGDAVGQVLQRDVITGDYIRLSDLDLSQGMAGLVGAGEWAVTLNVGSSGIGRSIQPGDEVAVIATFDREVVARTADTSQAPQKTTESVTLVLFPRVRVLANSAAPGRGEGGSEVILALPPQQAQVLIAAQRKAELTLALRRLGDASAQSRSDVGVVDQSTFQELLKGVKSVNVPDAPGNVAQ